jgi:photosystem II stability/assembly factor-like uncharacterized protein
MSPENSAENNGDNNGGNGARYLDPEQVRQIHMARGLSSEEVAALSVAALRKILRRLEYPDLAWQREAYRLQLGQNEQGVIPSEALPRALRQLDSARARSQAPARVAGVPTGTQVIMPGDLIAETAGLDPGHTGWTSLGPGNIGGRTRSIVIHPQAPDLMWAGSVGGGVWRTEDGGGSWTPVDDLMANLAVSCLVMDPTDPNILFAGTGEGFSNLDAIRGAGNFRTVDGERWTQLPSTAGDEFRQVNRLAISADGEVLLAATPAGIRRSSDPDRLSWSLVRAGVFADIDFHPTDSTRAVAGSLRDGQAFFSTDGGLTWDVASHDTPWNGRVEVTYAAADPSIVYASVQGPPGEIWRSTDGGRSYSRRASRNTLGELANYLGQQGWYGNVIWAGDPADSNFVVVGGIDLWRSTDGGNTLVPISDWRQSPRSAHADHHCVVAHPQFGSQGQKRVFFGNDGGIYRANDIRTVGGGAGRTGGWTELINTFTVTQFYAGAGNIQSGVIIGGAQDNGTLRFTPEVGTEGWTEMFGGDGGYCAADPGDPNIFYGEYVHLNIHRSLDGGKHAEFISGNFWNGHDWAWKLPPFRIPDAKNQKALFIAPFILDPNNSNRILAGGFSLWRTNDAKTPNTDTRGPSWSSIKSPVGTFISAIAVAQGDPDLIWVGHVNGDVFRTRTGTQTNPLWEKMDGNGPNPLPDRSGTAFVTRITIDPGNHDLVYVTFAGFERGNVWRTANGGQTWSNIGNALPKAPVHCLTIHPDRSSFLYLGTEVGIFASEDGGTNWSPTNEGPTNCSVDDLFWMDRTLVSATHGRGMFQIDLSNLPQ